MHHTLAAQTSFFLSLPAPSHGHISHLDSITIRIDSRLWSAHLGPGFGGGSVATMLRRTAALLASRSAVLFQPAVTGEVEAVSRFVIYRI